MIIYKITNIVNNKVYIGQTTRSFNKRKLEHFKNLEKGTHKNKYLQFSFNKYGKNKFTMDLIDVAKDINDLNILEQTYIKKYNSNSKEFGYNLTSGGLVCEFSEEAKRNMSEAQKKFYLTDEGKERLKQLASYAKGRTPWNKGTVGKVKSWSKGLKLGPQSSELIKKRAESISKSMIGNKNHRFGKLAANAKQIKCIQNNKIYNSSREAARELNLNERSIRKVASNERKSLRGYTFIYLIGNY